MKNKLYRSRVDKKVAGVCGGLGDYFDVDPTIIRIIFVISGFFHGIGLLAYIVAWVAMPQYPMGQEIPTDREPRKSTKWNSSMTGIVLIGIGIVFLADQFFLWFRFHNYFWPIILILVGVAFIIRGVNSNSLNGDDESNSINSSGEINNA